jgi:hypothetical protein
VWRYKTPESLLRPGNRPGGDGSPKELPDKRRRVDHRRQNKFMDNGQLMTAASADGRALIVAAETDWQAT